MHRFHFIGVDTAKDTIFYRLKIQNPGENYIHFSKNLTPEYYIQLQSEFPKWVITRGHPKKIWVLKSGVHNEALDCFTGGLAALFSAFADYEHCCKEYEAIVKNQKIEPEQVVKKSGYLERFRYK